MTDWSWSDLQPDEVKPRTETVDLCLDGTIQKRLEDAEKQLRRSGSDDALDSGSSQLQDEVDRLREQAQASTRTFTVRSCGHRRWRELLTEHRSDDPNERYDAETFLPAAFADCVDQFDSAEQVVKAQDMLTTGQVAKLFAAVRRVNEGDDEVPLLRGR